MVVLQSIPTPILLLPIANHSALGTPQGILYLGPYHLVVAVASLGLGHSGERPAGVRLEDQVSYCAYPKTPGVETYGGKGNHRNGCDG